MVGLVEHAVDCATTGGVNQLVKVLALEWGPLGITANAIAPTFIYAPGTVERLDGPDSLAGVVERILVGHVATVDDTAGAAISVASDAGRMLNDTVHIVDGGWTAQQSGTAKRFRPGS